MDEGYEGLSSRYTQRSDMLALSGLTFLRKRECWENIPGAVSLTELVVRKHHHLTILGAAELTSEAVRVS